MLVNLKNRTPSTDIEYYQEIWNIRKKKFKTHFKTLPLFSKWILLILSLGVFICRASGICSRRLLISCAIIVVFSTRVFRKMNLEIECVFRCKAMELESLRCIVSRLERVVVIRPTYSFLWRHSLPRESWIYIRRLSYQEVHWTEKSYRK